MAKSKSMQTAMPSPSYEDKYQAEDDHRTLMRAEEVRMDSKRFGAARSHGKRQLKALTRVIGGSRR